jgi:hypothetical protein
VFRKSVAAGFAGEIKSMSTTFAEGIATALKRSRSLELASRDTREENGGVSTSEFRSVSGSEESAELISDWLCRTCASVSG